MSKIRIKFTCFIALVCISCGSYVMAQNATVTVNQDREISQLLALKKEVNTATINYKIQIYNGSRSGADNAQANFYKYYSGWSVKKVFETPNYKIWVGNFETRLEADRALERIKRKFSNAFIFRPKKEK